MQCYIGLKLDGKLLSQINTPKIWLKKQAKNDSAIN
jgi:hypothetical protein